MKPNIIVAIATGMVLGIFVGRATREAPPAPAVAARPTANRQVEAAPAQPQPARRGDADAVVYKVPIGNSPIAGKPTAKVTMIESTDFQCPFCSRANGTVHELQKIYGDDLRVVVKQNPLSFHAQAMIAAQAALAAGEQGKYWEMHDKLFANAKALTRPDLEKYAQELGLDMAKFKSALDTEKFKAQILEEQKLVVGLGAGGTPAFFINGRKLSGAQPIERFKALIDEELKKADALLASGTPREQLYEKIIANGATSKVEEAPAAPQRPSAPPPAQVKKIDVPDYSPVKGPKAAKVTIVEWSDFQCPFCNRAAGTVKQISETYGKDVRVVFRHQPLSFHQNATPAAKAAMAAHKQGKFWEMHDKLFEVYNALSPEKYEQFAKELGLDMAKFKKDMEDPAIAEQIQKDSREGGQVGANGTPTFFVNGRKLEGAQPFDAFKAVIDEEIKAADALLAKGVKLEQVYEKRIEEAASAPAVKMEIGNSPVKGNKNAPVVIYAFSEFQCPFCNRVLPTMKQIEETYGNKVAIVFKQFPLAFHQNAQLAGEASLAAHEQGKFWEMHDKLFANQSALQRADLEKYAQELRLDMNKFKAALDSGKYTNQVKQEMASGQAAGISGTPSFVINGELLVGAQPFDAFKNVIDAQLAKAGVAAK